MTEPEPTAADEPSSAPDAVPDASPSDDRADLPKRMSTRMEPAGPISGADIREVDTSDLVQIQTFLRRSAPTHPTGGPPEPAPPPSPLPDEDPLAAFYAAKWEPDEETDDRRYRGRRRVTVPNPGFWAATLAAVAVIGGLLYGVISLTPLSGNGSPEPTESATASFPAIAIGPSIEASVIPSATPTSTKPTVPPSSAAPPAFKPITIEAESGTVGGSAQVERNNRTSGKHYVRLIGNWGSGDPGTLTITTGIVPSAGKYAMTISYFNINGDSTRSAIITVNSVALPPKTFTVPDARCCYTLTVTLTLRAGTNTIVFANPTGHAPELDKLVINRPS